MDSFIFQITKCQGSTGRLVPTKTAGKRGRRKKKTHTNSAPNFNFFFFLCIGKKGGGDSANVKLEKEKFEHLQLCYTRGQINIFRQKTISCQFDNFEKGKKKRFSFLLNVTT